MNTIVKAASSALVGDGIPKSKKNIAIAIAALSDALQVALFPVTIEGALSPGELALDAATAVAMMVVLGFQWRLAAVFAIELVPGVALFPSWTAMALLLPVQKEVIQTTGHVIDTTGEVVEAKAEIVTARNRLAAPPTRGAA